MNTREEALEYGLTFPGTYVDAPFHDRNWQLVRVRPSEKAFLWTYERNGYININVKVDPEWRDFWRDAFEAVIPGWHQNKEHWNTIILDGSIPDDTIRDMIAQSYDLVADNPTKRYTMPYAISRRERWPHTVRLRHLRVIRRCQGLLAMHSIRIRIRTGFRVTGLSIQRENFRVHLLSAVRTYRRRDLWRME